MTIPSAIALIAARSGGHILPGLTLAKKIHEENPAIPLIFFFSKNKLDARIAGQSTVPAEHIFIKLENVPYKNPVKLFLFFCHFIAAYILSIKVLKRKQVGKVISMGGYISIPVCLAAKTLRIPIELYELNVTPGKAVSFLSRFAQTVYICFEETKNYLPSAKVHYTPYPLMHNISDKLTPDRAKQELLLPMHKKTILICGGSQGSIFINNLIKQWIELNPHIHSLITIIHQTGSYDKTNWSQFYKTKEIKALTFSYDNNMSRYYSAADVVISRAGAGSLFEIAFFGKPCIVIPLETRATDHQKYNAYAMAHHYPQLFTVIHEHHIKKNNTIFFSVLCKHLIYNQNNKTIEMPHIL